MKFSQRIERLSPSPIREILKVIDQPGMISFAGGLPSAESFPQLDSRDFSGDVLQYGPTEGEEALRQRIADDLCDRGLSVDADQILVLSGSQQGIDLVAKLFIDKGTQVAVEVPTYLAALQVFSLFGANYVGYQPADHSALATAAPRLLYTIPTFQNPTGYCYTREQRQALAARADQLGSVLFEDDPYRDLVYSACDRTPVCAFAKQTCWIYQSSFSKTFAPGLRLGYLACSKALYPKLAWLKQAADLHSNRLSQTLVLNMLSQPDERLHQLVDSYRVKRDTFQRLLEQIMTPFATWTEPAGGLFFWLTLKPQVRADIDQVLQQSLQRNVAFMPGTPFFAQPHSATCLRLNFSHATPAQMEQGLTVLAELLVRQ